MAFDVRATAAAASALLFMFAANIALAQERCGYMNEIPRPPTPDFPPQDFDGSLTWAQQPLVPVDPREEVCMEDYNTTTAMQIIFMEEEIVGDVVLARLNYHGNYTPYVVSPLLAGTFSMLGPDIRRIPEGGDWHLVITQRQDYENPNMQGYIFNIRVSDESLSPMVVLDIVNIDDNPPIIELFEPCQIPENGEPGQTQCRYRVNDADGEISTSVMRYTIESDRGDGEVFHLVREAVPNEWMWTWMDLYINQPLDFVENPLHIFTVRAWDSLPNNGSGTMMVEVQNVESRPPRWVEFFAVEQFDEKTSQTFRVRAIDADTGINKPIHYRLKTAEEDTFFHIETIENGAIFTVDPIDRDTLEREVFYLSMIAYKYGDNDEEGHPSFESSIDAIIIINDINDQFPRPFENVSTIDIREETAMTLDLQNFGFHDRDLGQNAQYRVHLESVFPPGAHEAFYIAPEVGYQRQSFIMGTQNHSMLDYEVPEFQHIQLRVVAIDMNNSSHVGVATVDINLINWNDEEPIFEFSSHTATFKETVGAGFHVATMRAVDRDIGDRVEHSLMGNAVEYLRIDQDTGDIYVSIDDAFDFHRQNQLFVQIRAVDTLGEPYHTATAQLVIQLEDVNNTPPTLRLPRGRVEVEENVPDGFLLVVPQDITATDPDTTAKLQFEIDWSTSYATKQGRETPADEYHNCVEIKTIYPSENSTGTAIGQVVVREIRPNVTIDFEEFEVLYVTVRVRDLNTEIGDDYDESTFTITIIDMNDNPPVWAEGSLTQEFRVREVSASGVIIGSVFATDIDGPLYNQVRYTIFPRNNTPADLVDIDFVTGQITVMEHQAIDADEPKRENLYYTVVASDKCSAENQEDCPPDPTYWEPSGNITIYIIDTNNKEPNIEKDKFNSTIYMYENATTGDEIVKIIASDLDRDAIYHTMRYTISYSINPRLLDFFAVDPDSGLIHVEYTGSDVLDRDGDEPTHRIFYNVIDNFFGDGDGNRNQQSDEVLLVLLDVNDNAPEMPAPTDLSWSISESLTKGVRLHPDIYAPDRDEPDTDNSRVAYEIIQLVVNNRDIDVPDLFTMIQIQNVTGELETAMDLKGYWGSYDIYLQAYDHGVPQQFSEIVAYELTIRPYNFHSPEFVFPQHGSTIRLAREPAVVGGILTTASGEFLERIVATDEDGLDAGLVTFTIAGDDDASQYFDIVNDGVNSARLSLTQMFPEDTREFQVTIRGTDGGTEPGPLHTDCVVTVVFVPIQGDPVFDTNQVTVAFIEKEAGLSERFQLPLAKDPKNHMCSEEKENCFKIFYSIVEGNVDGHFAVDLTQNIIYLVSALDRSVSAQHTLVVAASNSDNSASALPGSTITVTVNVREADPRPLFVRTLYTAGIGTTDTINRELLTVQATHSENIAVTYSIDQSTMTVDPTLAAVKDSAFNLHPQSGLLTLNIQPTASMHGMFEFQIVATDTNGATDRTEVKVYLISTANRIIFLFSNTLDQVEPNRDFIAQVFSSAFMMTCNIDQVVPANDNGVALQNLTEVRAHFIRDHVPVPADEIEQLRSDIILLRQIQASLVINQLWLQDFVTGSSPQDTGSTLITIYVLIALTVLLGFMCLVLLLTFIIRTRALNRRLEALSMTKYGSVDSGLNRVGLAAPGTNKHAIEGSNPIWNETIKAPDFDAISDVSNDSDLIGIEDLPQFRTDYFNPDDSDSMQGIISESADDNIATHNNNFGFNATPFSLEFGNTFRR